MSKQKQKQTMLTAKYDMKMLKQIVEIDDAMKARLCELVGAEDEVGDCCCAILFFPEPSGLFAGCGAELGLAGISRYYRGRGESRADEDFLNDCRSKHLRTRQPRC
mmetsp:Transcript_37612/g.120657  ORF Transcript_37612/g.120657 Transcript_37612/m.120657 type:complete len:106 (+) Transcript_37612:137-454(+)